MFWMKNYRMDLEKAGLSLSERRGGFLCFPALGSKSAPDGE